MPGAGKVLGGWGVKGGVMATRRLAGGSGVTATTTYRSLEELFRARWAPSVRLAAALTSDRDAAEEIVQDVFLALSPRFTEIDNPAGYLRTAVVNRCHDHHRRVGVRRRVPPPPPEIAQEGPELDELWSVLARLPERRRAALVLRYYEDLPVNEIARLLGCRPGTVSSLLHRGLADVKEFVGHGR
jgi:RNA polymerase sigma factor (sigma-70 family)